MALFGGVMMLSEDTVVEAWYLYFYQSQRRRINGKLSDA